MKFKVQKSDINGSIEIPGSKSHTIRSLFFSSMAEGMSKVIKPLISQDAVSALNTCEAFGAKILKKNNSYEITGYNGKPQVPVNVIDVGNSGTTLRIATGQASLVDGYTIFTGDDQIRNRPIQPLLDALNNLSVFAVSTRNNGKAPLIIKGRAKGGYTKLDGVSSQFLTALLMNAPLFEKDTTIELIRLNEIPYVDITLWWLDKLGVKYTNDRYKSFFIPAGQKYNAFEQIIPADFSSATFFLVLAAISGGRIELKNLDMTDPQGDKMVIEILKNMGAKVELTPNSVIIQGNSLKGLEIDMNAIPDALPAMAVAGCFADGETRLVNAPQARIKETDRIKTMYQELSKMGADVRELEDGLVIKQSKLKAANVEGHGDHRIVMALAIAGLNITGQTTINKAEAAGVTFPTFHELIKDCGGNIELFE